MNNSQNVSNVSKAEWLCAALIDFLPIAILNNLPHIVYNIITAVSYSSYFKTGEGSWHNPVDAVLSNKISLILMVLSAVYLLTKDAFGICLGKRIMGIKLQREGNDVGMAFCLLRNLLLAVFFMRCFTLTGDPVNIGNFSRNIFFIYCVAELVCVNFTNKTIGDNIFQLQLVRDENFVPSKINNRTNCLIVTCILFAMYPNFCLPNFAVNHLHESLQKLVFFIPALIQVIAFSYLFFKLIQPKAFRRTAIILFFLVQFGMLFVRITTRLRW